MQKPEFMLSWRWTAESGGRRRPTESAAPAGPLLGWDGPRGISDEDHPMPRAGEAPGRSPHRLARSRLGYGSPTWRYANTLLSNPNFDKMTNNTSTMQFNLLTPKCSPEVLFSLTVC